MADTGLLKAFTRIDRDNDGVIEIADLEAYAKAENVAPDFVQKWKLLFDSDNTGHITFDHFCEVLAISKKKKEEMIVERKLDQLQSAIAKGPQIYSTNMDSELKTKVMKILEENWNNNNIESSIQQGLMTCDRDIGPRWRYRVVNEGTEPPCNEAKNNKYVVFGYENGSTKHCVWQQTESKERTPAGCCFC